MNRITFGFIIFILLLISCTTKDGINFGKEQGALWVNTPGQDSARIFLDYRDTGRLTPALLENIPEGIHTLHLFLGGYRSLPDSILVNVSKNDTAAASFELVSVPSADIEVNSSPDSARILINKLEFGVTPLNIRGLPAGTYSFSLLKSNFGILSDTVVVLADDQLSLFYQLEKDIRKTVLLEHFSNTSCPPCPVSDAVIDDTLSPFYGERDLVIIGYHASFPSSNDPMYQSAKADNDLRMNFYQPPAIPRAYVDGATVPDPLSPESYKQLIEQRLIADTVMTIAFLQLNRMSDRLSGRLELELKAPLDAGYRLFIVLLEDEINYASPPGNNGQTHFRSIMRAFYPDANGSTLQLNTGDKQLVDFNFTLSTGWGSDLTVVAFVQHTGTKNVVQAGWTRFPPF